MKIKPRTETPELTFDLLTGGSWNLADQSPDFMTLVVFYRGLHCPICSKYINDLDKHYPKVNELGVETVAVSSDTQQRAKESKKEWGIEQLPIGYGLNLDMAQQWGLFISSGIKDEEPERFSEPGLFMIKPDQTLYASSIQTMPFARPNFDELVDAIKFIQKNDYPARGEI